MGQLHKFTKLLQCQLRYFLFQDVLQKVRMCAVPYTEWGVESPSHFLFCCDIDIFGPPINKRTLFKDKYINRGRFAHTFCGI